MAEQRSSGNWEPKLEDASEESLLNQAFRIERIMLRPRPSITKLEVSDRFVASLDFKVKSDVSWATYAGICMLMFETMFPRPLIIPIDACDLRAFVVWCETPNDHPLANAAPYCAHFRVTGAGAHEFGLRAASLGCVVTEPRTRFDWDTGVSTPQGPDTVIPSTAIAKIWWSDIENPITSGTIFFLGIFESIYEQICGECDNRTHPKSLNVDGYRVTHSWSDMEPVLDDHARNLISDTLWRVRENHLV
ncbi:hypothetical protein CONPUDRAFT_140043 [Coniophora puteana RWD-64-598 SS2]|uniref:Uncharacterized protein n=1 Tax=Coniophora puteana (strain RWD-64-598) TaxID=741705 RepID=A0A5M3M8V0_CONPW|nr:uncharacterized protein CONPUDRAFT_140043 [Coniophora puteana RWD-64-598 SS2]EIW75628.1 hypothetical protein CONPUDRAFT_140043 [Coniophora puteana RWD-64-598 SS2]